MHPAEAGSVNLMSEAPGTKLLVEYLLHLDERLIQVLDVADSV